MIVVSDSSPLIILAKLNCFDFLRELYSEIYISNEVYSEVVIDGAGLPGASEVAKSGWIQVRSVQDTARFLVERKTLGLGAGELSTIIVCREIGAGAVLIDDFHARELAKQQGLRVRGTVGILETLYLRGYGIDLRSMFQQLMTHNVYIDKRLLNRRLQSFGLGVL